MTNPYDPAFTDHPVGTQVWTGLTKREYFAAMAMQGILANGLKSEIPDYKRNCRIVSEASVNVADALIAELNK